MYWSILYLRTQWKRKNTHFRAGCDILGQWPCGLYRSCGMGGCVATGESGWFRSVLTDLVDGRGLPAGQAGALMDRLLDGGGAAAEAGALLVALRMKGETAAELAAAARALRARMVPFPTGRDDVLDTCGTGGDGAGTFNISTAVAFVAAGAGVSVVKHGNRAASGRSSSADVLCELGLPIEAGPARAGRGLRETRRAVCFAPAHLPPPAPGAGARRP